MKKRVKQLAAIGLALVMACSICACGGGAPKEEKETEKQTQTENKEPVDQKTEKDNADSSDFSTYSFEDFDKEDWDAKKITYQFLWIEGQSMGGMSPTNELGGYTANFRIFMNMYEDGSLVGYELTDSASATSGETMYDANNRISRAFAGYWTKEDSTLKFSVVSNKDVTTFGENPEAQDYSVEIAEDGTIKFDLDKYMGGLRGGDYETWSWYTLYCDGTVHYDTATAIIDEVNTEWDNAGLEE